MSRCDRPRSDCRSTVDRAALGRMASVDLPIVLVCIDQADDVDLSGIARA